ncbi:MAG: hypothetical protein RLN62_02920 [Rickettsiales bacterium]
MFGPDGGLTALKILEMYEESMSAALASGNSNAIRKCGEVCIALLANDAYESAEIIGAESASKHKSAAEEGE